MSSTAFLPLLGLPCIAAHPPTSSRPLSGVGPVGQLRLPTDPEGVFTLTLIGLVVGSAIQVETATGSPVAWRVAGSATESFSIPAYPTGSVLNNLAIKVRKGSVAPYYQPFQTQATAYVGTSTVFVSQAPDE